MPAGIGPTDDSKRHPHVAERHSALRWLNPSWVLMSEFFGSEGRLNKATLTHTRVELLVKLLRFGRTNVYQPPLEV